MQQVLAKVVSNSQLIRYAVPGRPSLGFPFVIYHLICAEAPEIASKARPGQFVTVSCGSGLILRRPLSIHLVKGVNQLYLLFAVVGKGTQWLSQCREGEKLDLLGPLGNGFSIESSSKNLLLVAGGIGIAPIAFLAHEVVRQGKSIKLLLGARTKDGLYPENYLPLGIETIFVTEDGTYGKKGMLSEVIAEYALWADHIYACGPKAMYEAIAAQMQRQRIKKPVQISLELRMGCGIGACLACTVKTKNGLKQICKDGPVFNLDEVVLPEVRI